MPPHDLKPTNWLLTLFSHLAPGYIDPTAYCAVFSSGNRAIEAQDTLHQLRGHCPVFPAPQIIGLTQCQQLVFRAGGVQASADWDSYQGSLPKRRAQCL